VLCLIALAEISLFFTNSCGENILLPSSLSGLHTQNPGK